MRHVVQWSLSQVNLDLIPALPLGAEDVHSRAPVSHLYSGALSLLGGNVNKAPGSLPVTWGGERPPESPLDMAKEWPGSGQESVCLSAPTSSPAQVGA